MHLETLKVFCDVVETKSFSAAASQNFVTQSAVSQQVRMLEDRWGRRLLERTRGNRSEARRLPGASRATLWKGMRRLGLGGNGDSDESSDDEPRR